MDKLAKLQEVMKLVNEGLSKQDFLDNFKIIVDLIKKLKADNEQRMAGFENRYDGIVSDIKRNYYSDMEAVKEKALSYCMAEMKEMMSEHKKKMAGMEETMEGMEERIGENLIDEAVETATEQIVAQLPTVEDIMKELPKAGGAIRDSLELLPEGEKLKIEAIEKLREELDELRRLVGSRSMMGGGGAVGLQNAVKAYDLSASLNGVTTTFSLPAMTEIKLVQSSSNPFTLRKTTDWTHDASANTITFTSQIDPATTLASGQTLIILYF